MYSARYGNIYSVKQLLQLVQEVSGERDPSNFIWNRDDRYFDALRPLVEPEGYKSFHEVVDARKYHIEKVKNVLNQLDLFIFTLGVTEMWLDKETNTVYAEIKVLDNKRKNILDNIDKVADLEDKYEAYQYYLDAVKRDGVPYDLITKALPTIEDEVNNILSQLVDFSMTFEMDGKNINNYIVYDDNIWPLELSSGMERFISSLAIRVGLMNVSNLPRSNFLAIDEGWGTMDSENLNSVAQLFQYMKTQFQFSLVVSHIESMRDFVDTLLEIKKVGGSSSVRFSRD